MPIAEDRAARNEPDAWAATPANNNPRACGREGALAELEAEVRAAVPLMFGGSRCPAHLRYEVNC